METIITRVALYNEWNIFEWFIITQTRTETVMIISCADPLLFCQRLVENGSIQTNTDRIEQEMTNTAKSKTSL